MQFNYSSYDVLVLVHTIDLHARAEISGILRSH